MQRPAGPPLGLVVTLTGLSTLGAEIATARLLAPAFGSSTVIWANTIAIVLVALAIGHWIGGRLADAGPSHVRMHQLLLGGAALMALTPIVATPLLSAGIEALDEINAPGFFGSLVAVLLLVAVPIALLGAASPYAVRLALDQVAAGSNDADAIARAGRVSGRLSALGTGGSLVGTFISALVLIPLIGTRRTFLLMALILALLAAWGLLAGRARSPRLLAVLLVPAAIVVLALLPVPTVKAAGPGLTLREERETSEQYARVLEDDEGARTMELGEGHAIHSLLRPGTVLTGGYWDELLVLPQLADRAPRKVLILGNAGGTTATALRKFDPQVEVDAVDYDGQLAELGKKWFGLGGPRLNLITGDARVELRRSSGNYDAILVDAYRQPYIPFHLATKQFFALAKERLAPGGVVIINVGHPEGDTELERVLTASMQAGGLRHVLRDPAQSLNVQLIGRAEPFGDHREQLAAYAKGLQRGARWTARFEEQLTTGPGAAAFDERGYANASAADRATLAITTRDTAARIEPSLPGTTVYTDDRAPVELLIDGSLAKVATGDE